MTDLSNPLAAKKQSYGTVALRWLLYLFLGIFVVYYLMPLFVMVTTSLKSLEEIRTGSLVALPRVITFEAWKTAWSGACTGIQCEGLQPYFWNSVLLAVPAVILSTLIGALNGYVVAQWQFRGANLIFSLMLFGCFIPFQVVLLPMARMLGLMGLAGSIPGLIFVHVVYGWADVLPASIAGHMKCEGTWCAAPVNVHRIDWIWANAAILEANGIAMPSTWAEFNAAAEKLQAAGITPLAHGGQAWQDATVFEAVALGVGGAEFFQKAFVELDEATLTSDTMKALFDQMRTMRGFVDSNFSGRDWNLATAMVMNGEAAFQIMGDWAKGEFLAAGKQPGKDFLCASTPGEGFLYNVDSFAMFDVAGDDKTAGQLLLAELIVGKNFQKVFNLNKGSIPARTDVDLDEFDSCAHTSAKDMADSNAGGSLLPSYAHGMALRGAQSGAITDVVTSHFNSDMSSDDAVQMLLQAVQNSM